MILLLNHYGHKKTTSLEGGGVGRNAETEQTNSAIIIEMQKLNKNAETEQTNSAIIITNN